MKPITKISSHNCIMLVQSMNYRWKVLVEDQDDNKVAGNGDRLAGGGGADFSCEGQIYQLLPLKRRSTNNLHGSTTQKTALNII
jgi:hypothetical protein